MSVQSGSHRQAPTLKAGPALPALRILALLSVLNVLFQGATAGEVLMHSHTALELHAAGAIVTHVLTGLTTIAAGLYWRAVRGTVWPTLIAAIVFVATFVQAVSGDRGALYIHVPLALLLVLGSTWVLAWAWLWPARQTAARA